MTTIIGWTGHRPKDLTDWNFQRFASTLEGIAPIERWKNTHFVTGGALGVDTWAAEWALMRGIPFDLYLPFDFETMSKHWVEFSRRTLALHMTKAKSVTIIHEGAYDISAYQRRNEAMVDASHQMFTLWTGKEFGGTANCIAYAQRVNKPVYNIITGTLKKV